MFGFLDRLRASPHRWCQSNLSAYIDKELPAREHERVRRHLEQCTDCRRELQGLEHTVALLRQLPQARAPRSFYVPESAPAPSLPVWMRPWAYGALRMATAAAAALFVVTVAGNVLAMPAYLRSAVPAGAVSTESAPALATAPQAMRAPAEDAFSTPTLEATQKGWSRGEGPTEAPTLTTDEAARATAAPPGMGGGMAPPDAPPTAEPEMVAAGQLAPEQPTPAPLAAALAEPTRSAQAPEALAEPGSTGTREDGSEAGPQHAADTYGASGLEAARLRLGRYPWRLWGAVTAALLAVLAGATLWLRSARARWP